MLVFQINLFFYQSSVLNEDTGKPSVLNNSPITKSLNAYLTATGLGTSGAETNTLPLNITAFAGWYILSLPAISNCVKLTEISSPQMLTPHKFTCCTTNYLLYLSL